MERPSHSISTLALQSGARRFVGASLALVAQFGLVGIFIGGLVVQVGMHAPPPLQLSAVDKTPARTPPPPIRVERATMPTAEEPLIDIAPETAGPTITTVTPQPPQNPPIVTRQTLTSPAATPDRAATIIPETHTSPPYPTLARRLGAQGKVMMRLTVQPDGTVGKAEVVTSSGRQDLDQAASQWITGHWTYRPAIRDGAPAAAQVMAAIQFSLSDTR